jgi:glycosyltransferase involved in cell wall biosynthesis
MICLFSPPESGSITGGHVYNRNVVRYQESGNRSLYCHATPEELPVWVDRFSRHGTGTCVLDSLYLYSPGFPGMLRDMRAAHPGRFVLLAHLLPELEGHIVPDITSVLGSFDRFITLSDYLKNLLCERGVPREAVYVCPPGVDRRYVGCAPPKRGDPGPASRSTVRRERSGAVHSCGRLVRIVTASNFSPTKNLDWLVLVFAGLSRFNWTWDVIGDPHFVPESHAAFMDAVAANGLQSRITVRGVLHHDALIRELCHADLFVLPSRFESYGIALLEANAMGVPVVANKVGGIPEAVRDGTTAVLCPVDDQAAWSAVLRSLLVDVELRERLRDNCLKLSCSIPSWREVSNRFHTCLEQRDDSIPLP